MDLDNLTAEDIRKSGEKRVVPLPPISPNKGLQNQRTSEDPTKDAMVMPVSSSEEAATNLFDRSQERPLLQTRQNSDKDAGNFNKVTPVNAAIDSSSGKESKNASTKVKKNRKELVYDDDKSQVSDNEADEAKNTTDNVDDGVTYINSNGQKVIYPPNPKFKHFKDIFQDLLKQRNCPTQYPIVSMAITHDSTRAISVTQKDNTCSLVRQFDLETGDELFKELIGDQPTDFIKTKEIEQNQAGNKFAIAYNNDGRFYIRIFGKENRNAEEIANNEINVNELVDIADNNVMCNNANPDPFINVVFINDDRIYVSLFHNFSLTHYHFLYDLNTKQRVGDYVSCNVGSSRRNFPVKSFFNPHTNEIYTIYRQSQNFIIQANDITKYQYDEEIVEGESDLAMGQMYLIFNKALVVSCSNVILFFQIEEDPETGHKEWKQYECIKQRGQIFFIKNNVRIQIVTEEKIFFYKIDQETLQPELENVMYNYMKCSQMMFGPKVKYCITYKNNQRSFDIYRRKYIHGFTVNVNSQNLEGAFGVEMSSMNSFIVAKQDNIKFYDCFTFQERKDLELPITLMESKSREPNKIIAIESCQNEIYVAAITGKKLVMNKQKCNQLYIFKKVMQGDEGFNEMKLTEGTEEVSKIQFIKVSHIIFKDVPQLKELFQMGICVNFEFKKKETTDRDQIFFCKKDQIFLLNIFTKEVETVLRFDVPLKRQPLQFVLNEEQNVFFLSSPEDGCIFDLNGQEKQHEIMQNININEITSVCYDDVDQDFYIICNMLDEKLGFFVLKIHSKPPYKKTFFIKWKHKLSIGDTSMYVLNNEKRGYKELIMGFKNIYTNIYDIFCIDISQEDHESIIFRHESFQLWESECTGFLLDNDTNDFVILNKQGMHVTSFGTTEEVRSNHYDDSMDANAKAFIDKREIIDDKGQELMLHSIESCNYLQLEKENYLQFNCLSQNETLLQIRQEYIKYTKNENNFEEDEMGEWTLFNVDMQQPTLRELLVFQSIYVSEYLSDITDLVQDQPTPKIFFKSCMELNHSNMVSMLSFDSSSLAIILDDSFQEHFKGELYPIFYKNKIQKGPRRLGKYYYRSAIDNALRNNQKTAVEEILKYIVKFQNNFISSWLFHHNIPLILNQGIKIHDLLASNVFDWEFELDEFPANHTSDSEETRPYNLSLFEIRKHYRTIFHEDEFQREDFAIQYDDTGNVLSKKFHKIKYSVNLLPVIGTFVSKEIDTYSGKTNYSLKNSNVFFLGDCADADEIEMFICENVQDLISFKWDNYGFKFHLLGTAVHMSYLILLFIYTYEKYVFAHPETEDTKKQSFIILAFVSYPLVLESIQSFKFGFWSYITEFGNFLDMMFIWGSIAMSILHYLLTPLHVASKYVMVIVLLSAIRRTFNFLRIFQPLSTIVTMLSDVIFQLRIFLTFFLILCLLFSLMFNVLGIGNVQIPGDFATLFQDEKKPSQMNFDAPNAEYRQIGMFVGNFFSTIRVATGDFAIIDSAKYSSQNDSIVFWVIWFFTVLIACVIFLNFIVAEASESYNQVNEHIEEYIQQQRAVLITEAEEILPNFFKKKDSFPKYIILRRIET